MFVHSLFLDRLIFLFIGAVGGFLLGNFRNTVVWYLKTLLSRVEETEAKVEHLKEQLEEGNSDE